MAISDVLYEADIQIREYLQNQHRRPTPPDPALALLLALMTAVRLMPGRDRPPYDVNTFDTDLNAALVEYRGATGQDGRTPPKEA